MKPRTITIILLALALLVLLRGRSDAARVARRKAAGTGTLKDSDATEIELFG